MQVGRVQDRLDRRNDGDVIAEQREIPHALLPRLDDRHGGTRHRGLETQAEEYNLPIRMLPRDRQRIERRVDHAHIRAVGLGLQQALARSRHPHRVAERGEDHLRPFGQCHAVINAPHRQHADRAARPVHEFHLVRQHLLNAVAKYGVRVPAANFHDLQRSRPVTRDGRAQLANLAQQHPRLHRIAELVDVFHDAAPLIKPPRSSASSVCTRSQRM